MIRTILSTTTFLCLLGVGNPVAAQKQGTANGPKTDVKFLEDITVDIPATHTASAPVMVQVPVRSEKAVPAKKEVSEEVSAIEVAHRLQFKFALLLDTEVELVKNMGLFG